MNIEARLLIVLFLGVHLCVYTALPFPGADSAENLLADGGINLQADLESVLIVDGDCKR